MDVDRARSLTIYGSAAGLLVAGGLWFVRAAPVADEADARVASGRGTAERLLPDVGGQVDAETMVLAPGVGTERSTAVPGGSYVLMMLCVGDGQVRVRLGAQGVDSGRAVPCADRDPQAVELKVGLADEFFMAVSAEADGPAVFRWRVTSAGSY